MTYCARVAAMPSCSNCRPQATANLCSDRACTRCVVSAKLEASREAGVAQLVEQLIRNQQVVRSIRIAGSKFLSKIAELGRRRERRSLFDIQVDSHRTWRTPLSPFMAGYLT